MKKAFTKIASVLCLALALVWTTDAQAGCNDPGACNFVSTDTDALDCCFDNCVTLDMTDSFGDGWGTATYSIADASGTVVASGNLDGAQTGDGVSVGQDFLCLVAGCYSITVGGDTFDSEIGWTLSGVDGGPISGGAPQTLIFGLEGFICTPGCTDSTACNYDAANTIDDGSCDYSCIGCTDSTACNYELDNTIDDGSCCFGQCIQLTVGGGSFDSEISWELVGNANGLVASGGAPFNDLLCVPADCYSFNLIDGFGDGWNGATYTATNYNGAIVYGSGTLADGSLQTDYFGGVGATCGCTDSTACNYDCEADVEDGSCCFDNCLTVVAGGGTFDSEISWSFQDLSGVEVASGTAGTFEGICAPDGCYVMVMNDSFGDGWNGASFTVSAADGSSTYGTGTLDDGATGQVEFGVPAPCGCTDSTACNFDPAAVFDDGTCGYEGITLVVGGGSFDSEISWTLNLDSDGTQVAAGGAGIFDLCLDATCYQFNMFDSFGDGWNGGIFDFIDTATGLSLLTGTLAAGSSGVQAIAIAGGDGCLVPGCTDDGNLATSPFPGLAACNYNALANFDDGSCEYTSCDGCMDDGTGLVVPAVFAGIAACDYDPAATIPAACDYSCIGCTDSTACNFDSGTTVDDGSCCFDNCVSLDLSDSFGDGWNGATYDIVDDFTLLSVASGTLAAGSAGTDELCLAEGCYTITVGGGTFDSEISWTLNGVQGGSVSGGAPESSSFGVGAAVCALGCTDSSACNYDASAVTDDGSCCFLNCVSISVGGGTFDSEITWNFYDIDGVTVIASGSAPTEDFLCLPADCNYSFEMLDSFGDGWNGASYTLTDGAGNVIQTNTLGGGLSAQIDPVAIGVTFGCTDPAANNWNPAADCDDGSCITCPAGEELFSILMFDSFGDGWDSGTWSLVDLDTGLEYQGGSLATGSEGVDYICLPAGCWSIEVGGSSFDSEISWELLDEGGNTVFAGGAPEGPYGFSTQGTACGIEGCTDSSCLNYNPYADTDDGSCLCPPANNDCTGAQGLLCGDQIDGTNINATDNEGLDDGTLYSGFPINGGAVWYVLDGTGDQVTISTCNSVAPIDSRIHVFEGTCGALVPVAANDDGCGIADTGGGLASSVTFTSVLAVDYYIAVSGFGGQQFDFTLNVDCASCPVVPGNPDCDNASLLPDGVPVIASTCCADPIADNPCAGPFDTSYGVWYVFNSLDFDTFDFELNNLTGANIAMTVWVDNGGGCGDLTALACCGPVTGTCAGDISQITALEPNTDYYFTIWTDDIINCGDFELTASGEYLGCTDPSAINYDSQATIDDGTCEYDCGNPPPANDLCDNAADLNCPSGSSVTVDGTTGCATTTGYPFFVLACNGNPGPGVWYNFTGTGELSTIYTCGSPTDTQIDIFTGDCLNLVCAQDDASGPNPGAFLTEIDDLDPVGGCGFFNDDDVYLQFVSAVGVEYYIYVSTTADGGFSITHECMPVIPGCMEPAACNYDSTANLDNGTCDFLSCVCADAGCDGTGTAYTMDMLDAFGDGWNGATYTITDGLGNVILTGDIDNADVTVDANNFAGPEEGQDYFCLCDDNCYTITVGGGSWDSEISWTLTDAGGSVNLSGGAPDSQSWTQGGVICGCTDMGACNYDSLADTEDGSCEYLTCAGCTDSTACNWDSTATIDDSSCCFDNCVTLDMFDSFGDGWNGAIYEIFDWATGTLFASGTMAGSFESAEFCMPEGCYYIEVGGGTFDSEISWTLNGVNNGPVSGAAPSGQVYFSVGGGTCETCQEENACNYDLNAPVSDCNLCEYASCAGCTYPEALNYDTVTPATLDDGSCVFCLGDFDNNGFINTSDLLAFLTGFGLPC